MFHFLWCSIFSPLLFFAMLSHCHTYISNTIDTNADIIPVHSLSFCACMSAMIISCILLQRLPLRVICTKNFTMKHLPTSTKCVHVQGIYHFDHSCHCTSLHSLYTSKLAELSVDSVTQTAETLSLIIASLTCFYSLITLLLKYNISQYLHFAKY